MLYICYMIHNHNQISTTMQYRKLALIILLSSLIGSASGTHYMGGEITWECTSNGNFRFIIKLYRECAGIPFSNTVNLTTNIPNFSTIQTSRISMEDISPSCDCPGGPNITCAGTLPGWANSNSGAIQMDVYTTDQAYPFGVPLQGIPPATGWFIGYTSCCRTIGNNIQGANSYSWFLRAWMFPYNNTPVNTCFDNSPVFREAPSPVFCTSKPIITTHNASDPDGDSLAFSWAQPLASNINSPLVGYFPGYSFDSPMPDTMHHVNNVPATLDPESGLMRFTSYTSGAFVTVTRIASYKNGVKVSEVFREIQIVLLSCGPNSPPQHTIYPLFTELNTGEYLTTVTAGDLLNVAFMITDYDTCTGTIQPQSISLMAFGEQFGQPVNPAGCTTPPCATLSPSPTDTAPLIMQGALSTAFAWQTSTDHLKVYNGYVMSKRHTFFLQYQDNHCPVPGRGSITLHVDVTLPYATKPTNIACIQNQTAGTYDLVWEPTSMPDTAFVGYDIMTSTNPLGPFTLATQIPAINTGTFTHQTNDSSFVKRYYYINTQMSQPIPFAVPSNHTTPSLFVTAQPNFPNTGSVHLQWEPIAPAAVSGSTPPIYEIYRDIGNGYQFYQYTYTTDFTDHHPPAFPFSYQIESPATDPSGTILFCRNISNPVHVQLTSVPIEDRVGSLPYLYPNPSMGTFTLLPGSFHGDALIEITTTDGALIRRFSNQLKTDQEIHIHVEDLAPGLYLMRITTEKDQHIIKMVKE